MSFYSNVIKQGKASQKTTTANPTDWLKNPRTVHKYYQSLYKRVKSPNTKLATIKAIDGEYRLRIQCGKFSHPLWSEDDSDYDVAHFPTKEDALAEFKEWIEDLKAGVPGVVKAVNHGYNLWKGETVDLTQYYSKEQS